MASIIKATKKDYRLLAEIGKTTQIESHGSSAPAEETNSYLEKNFNYNAVKEELSDPKNIYHFIYYNGKPAGYSKITLNSPHSNIPIKNVTKLDRLYLLKEFYDLKLGRALFNFNVELSSQNDQAGMWLFVWKENQRAVNFYKKMNFKIIGSHDFKLSDNHSTPNHQMFLAY
jgi:ribosomal protein S18 acetylase RimI-like enzyme